jgi:hypothetical protein
MDLLKTVIKMASVTAPQFSTTNNQKKFMDLLAAFGERRGKRS